MHKQGQMNVNDTYLMFSEVMESLEYTHNNPQHVSSPRLFCDEDCIIFCGQQNALIHAAIPELLALTF